jgi:RIO kinase 1
MSSQSSHPRTASHHTDPFPLDPLFDVDYRAYDDPGDDQRWSTWHEVEPLCRGPEPRPGWVVTSRAAVDTELGVLKTGKEADVSLLDRAVPDDPQQAVVMAAKRYRGEEHRTFHRSSAYTEGRRTRSSRDARAMAKKTSHGRAVAAGQWAWAEWEALTRFWVAGVPVPRALLPGYFEQLREAMAVLARHGVAHGDLSAYNLLAAGDRLVLIDLPQAVDIVANPAGMDFLMRDCHNVATWFTAKGFEVDEHGLFADLLAAAL